MADWAIEPLADHHDRAGFDCGKPPLDEWIRLPPVVDVIKCRLWFPTGRS